MKALTNKSGSGPSLLERLFLLGVEPQNIISQLTPAQLRALPYAWDVLARPSQLPPAGSWRSWVVMAGRGFGKTRLGAEWVRSKASVMPGSRGALVGQTPDECRRVMVEGPAGLLAVCPPNERPTWEPSKGVLVWPNGSRAEVYSGANPEGLRGPQHHWAWCDEFAKFRRARETLDHLSMGLRLEHAAGEQPQALFTTTPRPIAALRGLVSSPSSVVTRGTTFENSNNLASSFLEEMRASYEGTRIGRQELGGELLEDVPGALWSRSWFDAVGFRRDEDITEQDIIAVGIDPAASNKEESDETGIVAAGVRFGKNISDRRYHVFADASLTGSPSERARAAIRLFESLEADVFVVEVNNGGDWIPAVIKSEWAALELPGTPKIEVVHASRGKRTRAEPISTLYESGRVTHHTGLTELEDQLATWSSLLGEESPDRLDADVWALTYLSTAKKLVAI